MQNNFKPCFLIFRQSCRHACRHFQFVNSEKLFGCENITSFAVYKSARSPKISNTSKNFKTNPNPSRDPNPDLVEIKYSGRFFMGLIYYKSW